MNFKTPHALQVFWDLAAAPVQTQALLQALENGLFSLLQQESSSAEQIAARLQLHPLATDVWLELLWSMGLLVRESLEESAGVASYRTSPNALTLFTDLTTADCSMAWRYRQRVLASFADHWPDYLKSGFSAPSTNATQGSWAQAAREQISQEQRAITVPAVLEMFKRLPALSERGHFLDLGGGPGHVGIAIARQLPRWTGVICDQKETAAVAAENIEVAELSTRLSSLGCDLNREAFGAGYDFIWCSSVLHFIQQPQTLLERLFEALNPGGALLLAHAECPDDAEIAAWVLPYYSAIRLRGGFLAHSGDIPRMLTKAGFTDQRALGRVDFPMAPVWLHWGQHP